MERTAAIMKDDTISRQDAIALLEEAESARLRGDILLLYPVMLNGLKKLPSAQLWIPCSERMPEEHEWIGTKKFGTTISNEVYVTFETPDGERFAKHISFQDGKLSSVDEQRMKVWYKGAKPISWMPLPKPWEGEEHGTPRAVLSQKPVR